MTKTQFKQKSKELKKEVSKLIDNRIDKIINSGAVDFDKYENNYALPKAFISACGVEIQHQFTPFTKELQHEAKNIRLFI